ncbi:uncharacterized protein LOC135812603 [Sycon ciliatum]|uniref:uncharacterized protein LOC135812603 n=1 Tax=Sycon ciliatum TaxID=27933 RepID=UPI0031F6F9E7
MPKQLQPCAQTFVRRLGLQYAEHTPLTSFTQEGRVHVSNGISTWAASLADRQPVFCLFQDACTSGKLVCNPPAKCTIAGAYSATCVCPGGDPQTADRNCDVLPSLKSPQQQHRFHRLLYGEGALLRCSFSGRVLEGIEWENSDASTPLDGPNVAKNTWVSADGVTHSQVFFSPKSNLTWVSCSARNSRGTVRALHVVIAEAASHGEFGEAGTKLSNSANGALAAVCSLLGIALIATVSFLVVQKKSPEHIEQMNQMRIRLQGIVKESVEQLKKRTQELRQAAFAQPVPSDPDPDPEPCLPLKKGPVHAVLQQEEEDIYNNDNSNHNISVQILAGKNAAVARGPAVENQDSVDSNGIYDNIPAQKRSPPAVKQASESIKQDSVDSNEVYDNIPTLKKRNTASAAAPEPASRTGHAPPVPASRVPSKVPAAKEAKSGSIPAAAKGKKSASVKRSETNASNCSTPVTAGAATAAAQDEALYGNGQVMSIDEDEYGIVDAPSSRIVPILPGERDPAPVPGSAAGKSPRGSVCSELGLLSDTAFALDASSDENGRIARPAAQDPSEIIYMGDILGEEEYGNIEICRQTDVEEENLYEQDIAQHCMLRQKESVDNCSTLPGIYSNTSPRGSVSSECALL